jgi:hypothetical protein
VVYLSICFTNHKEAIRNGEELPSYNESLSRRDANLDNHTQRALTYSMRINSWGAKRSSTRINTIFGGQVIGYSTIDTWIQFIDGNKMTRSKTPKPVPFILSKFLKGNQKGVYRGLSDDAIKALVVYEHSEHQKTVQATKRLQKLFPDDQSKITLPIVQATI